MPPITYCTNIHPAETLEEVRQGLERYARRVKAAVSPEAPFPVGLRLSGQASRELADGDVGLRFGQWLEAAGLVVTTINGFPYGRFHHTPVKEVVYLPDWRDPERAAYSLRLARTLASWLPEGGRGSISTVPVGFRRGFPESAMPQALAAMRRTLEELAALKKATGRTICLAVEAEPGCVVETTPEMVALFDRLDPDGMYREHLTVCYDCCHQALQYENPEASLASLDAVGIRVGHVQVSSALHLDGADLSRLSRFVEPVYLHQAVARLKHGGLRRFDDLPEALAADWDGVESWRVHFHLPVFVASLPECATTQGFLTRILPHFAPGTPMEVETYTWSVLPGELKTPDVVDSIVREIEWVEKARSAGAEGLL